MAIFVMFYMSGVFLIAENVRNLKHHILKYNIMKKSTLIKCLTAALLVLPLLGGCTDNTEAEITFISEETTLTFRPGEALEQTISFRSAKEWRLSHESANWFEITPVRGKAGNAMLTVRMLQEEPSRENRMDVSIKSDKAVATFRIVQNAVIPVSGIALEAPVDLFTGDEVALKLKLIPLDAYVKSVVWDSSEKSVLSVDQNGNVKALAAGKSTISVTVDGYSDECEITVTDFTGTTFGDGAIYTFTRLSRINNSGVTVESGDFVVSAGFEIASGDTLVLEDNETVRMMDGMEITINGTIDFTPATTATVTRYNDEAKPKSIYLTGDDSGGTIRNVIFIDVPIRLFAKQPFTVDNCEFKYISTSRAAIDMGGSNDQVTVTNSRFVENNYPAIAGASNSTIALVFKDNYLEKNVLYNGNRPQINVAVGGNGQVEISGNEIIGLAETTLSGGIAVSNLLGTSGTNKVLIKNNKVRNCRYGITTNGVMDVQIIGNELKDNKYESNPMNGGSGISLYNSNGGQKAFVSGNTITGHLWGITVIGSVANGTGPTVNLGYNVAGDDYNEGRNVFSNNGNGGVLYDLYNNTPLPINAMSNTWGSVDQTEAEIERVIFHQVDDPTLGLVTFMPAYVP